MCMKNSVRKPRSFTSYWSQQKTCARPKNSCLGQHRMAASMIFM